MGDMIAHIQLLGEEASLSGTLQEYLRNLLGSTLSSLICIPIVIQYLSSNSKYRFPGLPDASHSSGVKSKACIFGFHHENPANRWRIEDQVERQMKP